MEILNKLNYALKNAKTEIKEVNNQNELNIAKSNVLGKNSVFAEIGKSMKTLSNDDKKLLGKESNIIKQEIEKLFNVRKEELEQDKINKAINEQTIDVTLDAKKIKTGSKHLLTSIVEEVEDLFISLGYEIKEGPHLESDTYNFEKLNLSKDHPARDMQDSFYIDENTLLRTHTSPVQIRTLIDYCGCNDIKIICPGIVFRRDEDDATHSHQFQQIEGLVVGKDITMADLKGTLLTFVQHMFGKDREIRMRPSYFPFTEPSVEVDVTCAKCSGNGCPMCKNTGWIEILGAGMVHKNVLEMSNYDSENYQGFAFGIGVERIAMLKYGVDDIRRFYTNDLRFLNNFKGVK